MFSLKMTRKNVLIGKKTLYKMVLRIKKKHYQINKLLQAKNCFGCFISSKSPSYSQTNWEKEIWKDKSKKSFQKTYLLNVF